MTYDVNDLIQMSLQELGVLETGQPVSAEDAQLLEDRIPSILGDLNARDVGSINIRAIKCEVLLPLAKIVAYNSYNAFSITDPTKISILKNEGGKMGEAEQTIKDVLRLRTSRQTMRTEMFTSRLRWPYGR